MFNSLVRDVPVTIKGVEFVIDRNLQSAQTLVLCQVKTGDELRLSYDALSKKFATGELKFNKETLKSMDVSTQGVKNSTERRLLLVDEETKKDLLRKHGYLMAISDENGLIIKGTQNQEDAINAYAKLHDSEKDTKGVPALSSVRRWHQRHRAALGDLLSLRRRERRPSLSSDKLEAEERERELFNLVIQKYYLKRTRRSFIDMPDLLRTEIARNTRYENCKVVSLATIYRRLANIPEFEKACKNLGWLKAKRDFPTGSPVIEPTYLLEEVELDHTQLDIIVIDEETGEPLGRPWLTVFLDKKSRMVVGLYLSMQSPNARSVVKAYRHAILSKGYVKELFGDFIVTAWPCMGIPERVITDNGRDLHAHLVKQTLAQFSDLSYLPKGHPQLKGRVERFFRTLNEGLFHTLDGTTFSNYVKCGDYDSKKEAIYTLAQVNRLLHKWIIDRYHNTVHRALGVTPLQAWQENVATMPPIRMPNSIEEIDQMLWTREQATLQRNGISIHSLNYRSTELMQIARQHGFGGKLEFFFDPEDITVIRVVVPGTESTIDVRCTNARYAEEARTLAKHKVMWSEAKKSVKRSKQISEAVLLGVCEYMASMEQEAKAAKKARNGSAKRKAAAGNSQSFSGKKPKAISESGNAPITPKIAQQSFDDLPALEVTHVQ